MTRNYKINYNQYKHLIDVCQSGDFLTESLDKPVGLITYRNLIAEDNVLYFMQNSERTCKVPFGLKRSDNSLKFYDLLQNGINLISDDSDDLDSYSKLLFLYFICKFNPSEYVVYHDTGFDFLNEVNNFKLISSPSDLDKVYSSICSEKKMKCTKNDVFDYKSLRFKEKDCDKTVIFILTKYNNVQLFNSLSYNCIRFGISYINITSTRLVDGVNVKLNNFIYPKVLPSDVELEMKNYRKMLTEYNNMVNGINVTESILDRDLEITKLKEKKFNVGDFELSSFNTGEDKLLYIKVPSNNWVYDNLNEAQLRMFSASLSKKLLEIVKIGVFVDIKCETDRLVVTLDKEHITSRGISFFLTYLLQILDSTEETFKVVSMIPNKLHYISQELLHK